MGTILLILLVTAVLLGMPFVILIVKLNRITAILEEIAKTIRS